MSNNREMTKCFLVWDETNVRIFQFFTSFDWFLKTYIFHSLFFSEQNMQPGSLYLY